MDNATFPAQGREWKIELNVGNVDAVRRRTAIDLPDPTKIDVVYGLLFRPSVLADVLAIVCEGLDRSSLDVDALGDGHAALLDAVINFTQPVARDAVRAAIEKQVEMQIKSLTMLAETMNGPEIGEAVDGELARAREQLIESLGELRRSE